MDSLLLQPLLCLAWSHPGHATRPLLWLQEERNAWSGETAALRGNILALESQVAAAQSAAAAADEARGLSTADAGRLRSEVAQLTKQRDQLQTDLTAQQQELTRLPLTHAANSPRTKRGIPSPAFTGAVRHHAKQDLSGPCHIFRSDTH